MAYYEIDMRIDQGTTLLDLVHQLRSDNLQKTAQAEHELYNRTKRFVQFVIRQSRDDRFRNRLTTQGLANAIEKSFLSYIRKPGDWEEQDVPKDKIILSILSTITVRYVTRELNKLASRPNEQDIDPELIGSVDGGQVEPLDEVEFVEFLENLKNAVRDTASEAIRILELRLEGFSSVEIQEELGIGRGKLAHIVKEIKRRVVLAYLEQQDSDTVRAYKEFETLSQMSAEPLELDELYSLLATQLECNEQFIQDAITKVNKLLGK